MHRSFFIFRYLKANGLSRTPTTICTMLRFLSIHNCSYFYHIFIVPMHCCIKNVITSHNSDSELVCEQVLQSVGFFFIHFQAIVCQSEPLLRCWCVFIFYMYIIILPMNIFHLNLYFFTLSTHQVNDENIYIIAQNGLLSSNALLLRWLCAQRKQFHNNKYICSRTSKR